MNQDIKKLWIETLEEKPKKAVGRLHNRRTHGRCCLGVLCDIYADQTGDGHWVTDEDNDDKYKDIALTFLTDQGYSEQFELPWNVRHWADLTEEEESELINVNDSSKGFKKVIEVLEQM